MSKRGLEKYLLFFWKKISVAHILVAAGQVKSMSKISFSYFVLLIIIVFTELQITAN